LSLGADHTMARPRGRTTTQTKLKPDGRVNWSRYKETVDEARSTVLEARLRQFWGVDRWLRDRHNKSAVEEAKRQMSNPLFGYALGRLLYSREVDQKQHDAGEWFIAIYRANARFRGWPDPNPKSIGGEMVSRGISCHPDDSPEWQRDMRRRFEDAYREIMDAAKDHGEKVYEDLRRVLIEDLPPSDPGLVRVGLNAVNKARGA
jgi:hypothetical protein